MSIKNFNLQSSQIKKEGNLVCLFFPSLHHRSNALFFPLKSIAKKSSYAEKTLEGHFPPIVPQK